MPVALVRRTTIAALLLAVRAPCVLSQDSVAAPRSRAAPVFVYDSIHDRLVLFGGSGPSPHAELTYAWMNDRWSVIARTGPQARDEVAFGSASHDGSIVMFGGRGFGTSTPTNPFGRVPFRDTWRFDGSRWTLEDTAGLEARPGAQGAYDPERRRFVVFGGTPDRTTSLANDTWEWDGRRWTRFDTPGPPGRKGHAMAYDATAHAVIVHGGVRDGVALTDTWAWNGTQWTLLTMEGPRSVFGAAAMRPAGGVVLFGGHTMPGMSTETWHLSGKQWKAVASSGPPPRTFNALATDARRGRIYMIGGIGRVNGEDRILNDLWYLDSAGTWVQVYRHDAP